MSLGLLNPPNVHLFFEYEMSFYFHYFFNDGDDRDIALLATRSPGPSLGVSLVPNGRGTIPEPLERRESPAAAQTVTPASTKYLLEVTL
jgi:hypothetical protein